MSDGICMICGKEYMWCCCEGFQAHDHEIERLRERIKELLPKIEEERREVARLRKLIKEMTTGPATVADG